MTTDQFNNALSWVSAKASEGYKVCHYILSLGSTYLIYNYVITKGIQADYNQYLVYALAFILANLWYRGVEHTLAVIMPFAVAWIMTDKAEAKAMNRTARVAARSSVLAVVIMLVATAALSFAINPQISESMNDREDSGREIANNEATLSSYDKDVLALREELALARARDAKIDEAAKQKAADLLNAAIYSKGNEMARLYKAGHGWAKGELKSAISRAKRSGSKIIAAASKAPREAPALQADLSNYMKRSGAARDTVATMTAAVLSSREATHVSNVGRTNTVLLLVVAFVFVIYIFLAFLMVTTRIERGEDIIDDDSPGVIKVAKDAARSFNKKMGQRLADKWDVKFVSSAPRALATSGPSSPVSDVSPTVSTVSPPLSPVVSPPAPLASPVAPKAPSSVVSAKTIGSVGKLTVEIDGKEYTPKQAMDKMRKWYTRGKTSKTEKTRKDNRAKYDAVKTATKDHFNFKERGKSVEIEQK